MSGRTPFARDGQGNCYILCTPTDVRIERVGQITEDDMREWGDLCQWAAGIGGGFAADNGLTPCRYGNTELDMLLARIAWAGETDYTLASLADGVHADQNGAGASFAEEIVNAAAFNYADREAPDGEYIVLNCPTIDARYDFFYGDHSLVRAVRGEYETVYTAGDVDVTGMVEKWYNALPKAAESYDEAAYEAAVDAVLAEYTALDQEALENFDEAAHPELPWYTAVVANPVRNQLYYGFYDFDGNGIPELVIAAGDDTWQQPAGIYAFDGETMRYLCKDHPLGERAYLTYFQDGVFAVQGSGGAAVGEVTIWKIAPDGYSTDLISVMDYEYQDPETVTYTPQFGDMTPEEFAEVDYLRGFDVPVEYARFAQMAGGQFVGIANPWHEAASAQEAAEGAGLESFTPPEYLTCFPAEPAVSFRYMEGLAEADYTDGTRTLTIRKGLGDQDVSGDYTVYPAEWEINHKGLAIRCSGTGETVSLARWAFGGCSWSLTVSPNETGLSADEVTSLVNQCQ